MAVTEIGVSGGRGRPNISSTSMTSVVSEARVLEAYSAHPSHVSIVKGNMLPIINDIMTVDSIADDLSTDNLVPLLGSAIRISFLKLKEDANKD